MRFLVQRSIKERLNQTLKPSIYHLLDSSLVLLAVNISGCIMSNPAHSPPIEGDIEISKDSKGDLCFIPLFSSTMSIGDFIDLDHIKMEELAILDPNLQGGGYVLLRIKPTNKKFFILNNGQKICLNSNNPNLEQTIYTPLDKQPLSVSIGGLDDEKKYIVNFYKEFDYPYTPE